MHAGRQYGFYSDSMHIFISYHEIIESQRIPVNLNAFDILKATSNGIFVPEFNNSQKMHWKSCE